MRASSTLVASLVLLAPPGIGQGPVQQGVAFTDTFGVTTAELSATGENAYLVLAPGAFVVLEAKTGPDTDTLEVKVLDEVKIVEGVEARVVEQRRSKNGTLVALARHCLAISKRTESVYCLGSDVATYEDGKVKTRAGSWQAGTRRAQLGLWLPGLPLLGARWQQGKALGVAIPRSEITSLDQRVDTPAGSFVSCVEIEQTTEASPGDKRRLAFAPGIGLVRDGELLLKAHGRGSAGTRAAVTPNNAPAALFPPAAALAVDAVHKHLPHAQVFSVGRGAAAGGGVVEEPCWIVHTAEGHDEGEHQVTAGGIVLRSRFTVSSRSAPAPVAEALAKLCDQKELRSVDREEICAVLRYVPLLEPMVTWVATVKQPGGTTRKITQRAGSGTPRPGPAPTGERKENDAAKQKAFAAVKALRPDATLDGFELVGYSDGVGEMEVLAYEVEFHSGGQKHEWLATSEGVLVEHVRPSTLAEVPEPVLKAALLEAAAGETIESIERREVSAVLRFAPCAPARLVWIAKWTKDGNAETTRIAADGRVLPARPAAAGKPGDSGPRKL